MKGEVKIIFGKTLIRKKLSPHLCLSRRTLLGGKYLFSEVVCDHEDAAGLEIWPKLGAEVIASPRCSGLSDCGNLKARIGSIIAWHWETWEGTWQLGWDDEPCHPDKTSSRAPPVPTAAQCYNQHGYGHSTCSPRRSPPVDPKR